MSNGYVAFQEIMWAPTTYAELKNDTTFYIRTVRKTRQRIASAMAALLTFSASAFPMQPKRNYQMASKDAKKWVELINKTKALYKSKENS
jgi:hypothetical protein